MKKLFAIIFFVVYSISLWAQISHDFEVGGIYYKILSEGDKTVEVTFNGYCSGLDDEEYTSSRHSYSGDVVIPKSVTYNSKNYSVTAIGNFAFEGCRQLSSVTIPNSVISIGIRAFSSCSGLTDISIPNSVTSIGLSAFQYCTSLPVIDNVRYADTFLVEAVDKSRSTYFIKNGTKWIGDGAFYECSNLSSIYIPASIISIGDAFNGCTSLPVIDGVRYADTYLVGPVDRTKSTYQIKEGTKWIGDAAFFQCPNLENIQIPNSVTSIGSSAFFNCPNLSSISIPNSVTTIGGLAFYDCPGLNSVIIGNSVTSVGRCTFEGCTSLANITIPNSVVTIGNRAFYSCSGLKSINIGESVKSIGQYAFSNCTSLTDISIPNSVQTIVEYAFQGCTGLPVIDDVRYADTYLVGVVDQTKSTYKIREGTKWIGSDAFAHCLYLADIEFPSSTIEIGSGAFYNCKSLESLTIPNSIKVIGRSAFADCIALSSITIGKSVKLVKPCAFEECPNLRDMMCFCEVPPTLCQDVFYVEGIWYDYGGTSISDCTLYVPTGSVDAYKNADQWSGFGKIVPMFPYTKSGLVYNYTDATQTALCVKAEVESIYEAEIMTEIAGIPVVEIAENGFAGCMSLTAVSIPNTVEKIGSGAFSGCLGITEIVLPNSVSIIGDMAFWDCTYLTNIDIPESATYIGSGAFGGSGVKSVTIPASVEHIGTAPFQSCISLVDINVASGNTNFSVDDGVLYNKDKTILIECLASKTSVTLADNTVKIADKAFMDCRKLQSIVTGKTQNIGSYAFAYCNNLKDITFSTDLTNIGNGILEGVNSLQSITCYNPEPPTLEANAFQPTLQSKCILYVPFDCSSAYSIVNQWKDFANIVELPVELPYSRDGLVFNYANGSKSELSVKAETVDATELTIPIELDGIPVTTIADNAFENCSRLLYVNFPNTITNVGNNIFTGCSNLAAIGWGASMNLPTTIFNDVDNPNLLLYIKAKSYAPSSVKNAVVNGEAESITLVDKEGNNNFYVPQAFTAKHISYTHNYSQETVIGKCAGWETIALPFDVQSITHSRNGVIAPFAANNAEAKPFWLYSLGGSGFIASTGIKANTPYIISMPNTLEYADDYILSGDVTFSADNVTVPETNQSASSKDDFLFMPTTLAVSKNATMYAINKGEMYDGQLAGSVFVSNLRDVSPFEAYLTLSGNMAKACINLMDLGFDDDTSGIAIPTKASGMKIWSENGTLYISTDKGKTVRIYTTSGMLVRIADIHEGLNAIENLPSGAYIVENKKVVVY